MHRIGRRQFLLQPWVIDTRPRLVTPEVVGEPIGLGVVQDVRKCAHPEVEAGQWNVSLHRGKCPPLDGPTAAEDAAAQQADPPGATFRSRAIDFFKPACTEAFDHDLPVTIRQAGWLGIPVPSCGTVAPA